MIMIASGWNHEHERRMRDADSHLHQMGSRRECIGCGFTVRLRDPHHAGGTTIYSQHSCQRQELTFRHSVSNALHITAVHASTAELATAWTATKDRATIGYVGYAPVCHHDPFPNSSGPHCLSTTDSVTTVRLV